MYTQCPECAIAFRVTAVVLKQAAGQVRCGGCGLAFNALEFLSENRPEQAVRKEIKGALPKLTPGSVDETDERPLPQTMSADQSAALLKTLDQLAGTDIRLEDTGIEWRVLSDDENDGDDEPASDVFGDLSTEIDAELTADAGATFLDEDLTPETDDAVLDELLEQADTPVESEEIFSKSDDSANVEAGEIFVESGDSGEVEAGEIFDESDDVVEAGEIFVESDDVVESAEIFDDAESDVDDPEIFDSGEGLKDATGSELRFDDNTGLPDDFDYDAAAQRSSQAKPAPKPAPAPAKPEDKPVDLAFGEPDEWGELLDEVVPADAQAEAPVLEAPDDSAPSANLTPLANVSDSSESSIVEELAARPDSDNDTPPDIDTQFGLQAEAMGIDLSGVRQADDPADKPTQVPEPNIRVQSKEKPAEDPEPDTRIQPKDDPVDAPELDTRIQSKDEPDDNLEFPEDTGELEFELAKAQEAAEAMNAASAEEETSIDDDLIAAAFEKEKAAELSIAEELEAVENVVEEEVISKQPAPVAAPTVKDTSSGPTKAKVTAPTKDTSSRPAGAKVTAPGKDTSSRPAEAEYEFAEFAVLEEPDEVVEVADDKSDDDADSGSSNWHLVPPETEEENTINRMIDQDLLRFSIEDEDGTTSAMVLEGKKNGDGTWDVDPKAEVPPIDPFNPGADVAVETIIMEGEFVRTALEEEALADAQEALKEAGFIAAAKNTMRGKLPGGKSVRIPTGVRIAAGAFILGLALAGQFVHQSRAELATVPSISGPLESIYNAVGAPITPDWDVTGWRFEVTKGSTTPQNSTGPSPQALAADEPTETDAADTNSDELPANDGETPLPADPAVDQEELLNIYSRIANHSEQPLPYPLISVSLTDRFEEIIGSTVLQPREYLTSNVDAESFVSPGKTFDAVISIDAPSADATGFKLNVCYRQAGGQLRCAVDDFK